MPLILRSMRRWACGAGWALLGLLAARQSGGAAWAGVTSAAARVAEGREIFLREWVPGDPRSHGGDGLGPLYNDTSCLGCHNQGGPGGGGPASKNVEIITLPVRMMRLSQRNESGASFAVVDRSGEARTVTEGEIDEIHPGFRRAGSVLLHHFGTDPSYRLWRLRRTEGVGFAEMAEGGGAEEIEQIKEMIGKRPVRSARAMSRPASRSRGADRAKGGLLFGTRVTLTLRNPPPLFGAGLIDAIPEESLRRAVLEPHPGFPTVRGRLCSLGGGRVGRFGWKAQVASLKEFVEQACAMELGLEVPAHHQARPPLEFDSRKVMGLDLTQGECDALTAYVAALPAPAERPVSPDAEAGRSLFARVGCAACHSPTLGPVRGIYSDLLLHNMGGDLAEASVYYGGAQGSSGQGATAEEWRTPPLWGFRDSAPYLHDGRADTLEQAVAFHGGQGEPSARLFFALSLRDRLKVQAFLNTLAAPSTGGDLPMH